MRSKSECGLITIISVLLIVVMVMVRENKNLRDELTLTRKMNFTTMQLVVQKADSIAFLQSANCDLNRSFMEVSKELKSCAKVKNILKVQSLLIKALQEQFPQYEASTKLSYKDISQRIE